MVLNKKSQVFFYTLMLGILVLVLTLAIAGDVKKVIDDTRNESSSYLMINQSTSQPGLNCSSNSLNNFDKGTCIISDISLFYFIGSLLMLVGAIITAKLVMQ